jgi:hypothetical protein
MLSQLITTTDLKSLVGNTASAQILSCSQSLFVIHFARGVLSAISLWAEQVAFIEETKNSPL